MKRVSFAVLAVLAGLYGCATTDSQDTTAADSTSPSATPGAAPSPSTRSARSGGVQPGTAQPPVGSRAGSGVYGGSDMKRSVYFEYDQYDVKPEFRPLLESHASWLRGNPQRRLTVEGNTDERGSREYNVALGQRRAEAVTKMMVLMGARPEQIEAISWGEERPRGTGHDEKSWSENRRSDFLQK
jgi:peptidoglycan-associated lipoprotein